MLVAVEIARVYYIMPFPGSQQQNSIKLAYFLHNYINLFRLIGIAGIVYLTYSLFPVSNRLGKWLILVAIAFWLVVIYMFNFKMQADKMFYEPRTKKLSPVSENKILPQQLVIGVTINNQSKAYPIEIIGYHHQVRDSVGGVPVMVTYCTVCRTGRVFSPLVNGEPETFRLVGMDHFNAMFEDSRTKSWWRQANGEAIAGPLKGSQLSEIPSEQMTLAAWVARHPNTTILQPDSEFNDSYEKLANYDEGKSNSKLTGTDSVSWQEKSWVVGIKPNNTPRAYDWIELSQARLINDAFGRVFTLLALEPDSASFHVWLRPDSLSFALKDGVIIDEQTSSRWDWNGTCTEGVLKGNRLISVQSYQEFWHSWRTFNPSTTRYLAPN